MGLKALKIDSVWSVEIVAQDGHAIKTPTFSYT